MNPWLLKSIFFSWLVFYFFRFHLWCTTSLAQDSQRHRGGGSLCFRQLELWNDLAGAVDQLEACPLISTSLSSRDDESNRKPILKKKKKWMSMQNDVTGWTMVPLNWWRSFDCLFIRYDYKIPIIINVSSLPLWAILCCSRQLSQGPFCSRFWKLGWKFGVSSYCVSVIVFSFSTEGLFFLSNSKRIKSALLYLDMIRKLV